ncbi:MAG: copper amine oxidase N-terminal domain-containing protein [Bacillota bacterium]
MTKRILSLILATSLLVWLMAPASYAKPGQNKWQSASQDSVQLNTVAGDVYNTDSVVDDVYNSDSVVDDVYNDDTVTDNVYQKSDRGRHKGIPNALLHVKNPHARAVLQSILDRKSVVDEVYRYSNEPGEDFDGEEADTVVEQVYDSISGDDDMDKKTRGLTYRYMAQIKIKGGNLSDALKFMNLAVQDNSQDEDAYKGLDSLYAKKNDLKVKVYVNGKTPVFDVPPQIVEGRTLVPVRFIAESLNANIAYDATTGTVTVDGVQVKIQLKINNKTAIVNGQQVELDVPAKIENGRTMVPLRFISEGFKCKVKFYGESNLVSITE